MPLGVHQPHLFRTCCMLFRHSVFGKCLEKIDWGTLSDGFELRTWVPPVLFFMPPDDMWIAKAEYEEWACLSIENATDQFGDTN